MQPKKKYPRTRWIGVDFQKIEEAPITDFERQVVEGITVQPTVIEKLIYEEKLNMIDEAIEHAGLSDLEIKCIKLTLDNLTPTEIVRALGLKNSTVHYYLKSAIRKLSDYIRQHDDHQ